MVKFVPDRVKHLVLPYNWNVEKVWALKAPIETTPVAELEFLLRAPMWSINPNRYLDFNLSPATVLQNPAVSKRHTARINQANIDWPLDFIYDGNQLWLLDGLHRLARISRHGGSQVKIRRHPQIIKSIIEV